MPGHFDRDDPLALQMTPYAAYRTGVAVADVAPPAAITQGIDLTQNTSGNNNSILLVPQATLGSGSVTVQLYQLLDGSITSYIPVGAPVTLASLAPTSWTGLRAALYKIAVTNVGSSTWTLHTSNTAQ